MTDDRAVAPPGAPRRILILGANGPTGRRTTAQALDRGFAVTALTRHPDDFPLEHERLDVMTGDATDLHVINLAVHGSDAVICTIGASFTRKLVDVYSTTARLLVDAMTRHHLRRIIAVTSSGLGPPEPHAGPVSGWFRRLMRHHIGKTVYDDMAAMEAELTASDLEWTIVRPPGLTDQPAAGYLIAENSIQGGVCSRDDLAALLIDQLDDNRFVRKVAAMTTPGMTVSARYMIWHEILKK